MSKVDLLLKILAGFRILSLDSLWNVIREKTLQLFMLLVISIVKCGNELIMIWLIDSIAVVEAAQVLVILEKIDNLFTLL